MPTLRTILDDSTRKEFDSPPIFDTVQRRAFFNLPQWAWRICKSLIEPHNQVMFGLQVGYFRASGRFFEPNKFYDKDIESVCRKLKVKKEEVLSKHYHKNSRYRHIQLILNGFNILPYADQVDEICKKEVTHLVKRQIKLHLVFGSLVNFIRERNFEVPTFSVLAALINEARDEYENQIQIQMGELLTEDLQELLSNFFEQYLPENDTPTRRNSPFRLTKLKTNPELMKVKIIRENMLDFRYLKKSYQQLTPILKRLDFSQNFIEELALQVMRSRTVQVKRLKNRNLYLLCFVQYQYFHLSDILTQTFINAVEQNINLCEKTYKKRNHDELETNLEKYIPVLENYLLEGEIVKNMKDVALGLFHTKEEKLNILATSLANQKTNNFLALIPAVRKLYEQTLRQKQDEGYFEQIEAGSQKLQAKVGDILRYLDFSSHDNLQIAIDFYQKKEGNLSGDIPLGFLKPNERKNVVDKNGKVRLSLYKSLLARHLSKGFKNGTVYVNNSHEFKAIDTYLIDIKTWDEQKLSLLERANLRHLESWITVQDQLENRLTLCFNRTFDRINNGENLWIEKRADQTLRFKTPKKEPNENDIPNLYPQDRLISLFEAMQTVNRVSNFTDSLTSLKLKNNRSEPDERSFFAAIMAFGCNLGVERMFKTTKNISDFRLETTINNHFSSGNLQKANDKVIGIIDRMMIHKLYKKDPSLTHTSSDGQKFDILLDSIHANFSFKYFGKEKGITIYPFLSESHQIFHGLAFCASDREAWYVLDGLMHNEIVESDVHSTDSHGSTDIIFALTYLLGIDFQPRIKQFHLAKLHGMAGMKIEQQLEYIINAGPNINTQIIAQEWDNILRLVTSIKLKHTVPSQILKRLNSYALQNPLYQALKELGKVVRTIFLLRYMDDETMRQRIHQQLVKGESLNGLGAAIGYGNGGKIIYANKEELLIMEGSRRLLENVVICWNYLYLTRLIIKANPTERAELLKIIPEISPVAWEHHNFQGEFDFDELKQRDQLETDLQEMFDFQLEDDE
jgi:TnpA family transposase